MKKILFSFITLMYFTLSAQEFQKKVIDNEKPYFGSYTILLKQQQASKTASTTCNNFDFEDGNYNTWNVFKGQNNGSFNPPTNVVFDANASVNGLNTNSAFNAIIDSAHSSEMLATLIPVNSPYSGATIARVNHIGNGGGVGILERQIPIAVTNPFINFSYFAFLENSPHSPSDQPYFKIFFFDSNNDTIPGTFLQVTSNSSSANSGFLTSNNYYYKPWTPVSVDLSAYAGQVVTAQFIAADCIISQGAHGGHIYIDFDCYNSGPAVQNTWPGDANYDLTVNFADLFYVGAGYANTGPPRATIDNSYSGFTSTDWNSNSLYLVNSKHADCNGDGTIDGLDSVAINQNYGLTHLYKSSTTQLTALNTTSQYSISITSNIDTVAYGQNLDLTFSIGDQAILTDSLYGIGFSLNYPSTLIDPVYTNQSCTGSILGTYGTDLIKLAHPLNNNIDMVAVRTDHQNKTNFYGNLFTLKLKANQFITNDSIINFSISNIKAISKHGYNIPVNAGNNKPIRFKANAATGINNKDYDLTSIFPNPAQNKITISCPSKIENYEITSVIGNIVKKHTVISDSKLEIDISDLAKSVYFISITTENGNKIIKQFIKL